MKNFKFYWEEDRGGEPSTKVSVPGFSKDEINVHLTSKSIKISAEKKHSRVEKGKNFYREESFSRGFSKYIALPHRIDPHVFEVSVHDGEVVLKRRKKAVKKAV